MKIYLYTFQSYRTKGLNMAVFNPDKQANHCTSNIKNIFSCKYKPIILSPHLQQNGLL